MNEHPYQLYAVGFSKADHARLAGFSCGEEPWSRHVTEWILGSDVLDSMVRGTHVWLFETERGEIVGFGAVGMSTWHWPPPKGSRTTIVLIPMFGIDVRYRGEPPEPDWRYSRQVMSHLIAEGQRRVHEWTGDADDKPQWLVLMVHRENTRAIRFYEKCGFELIQGVVRRNDHLVMKLWIAE